MTDTSMIEAVVRNAERAEAALYEEPAPCVAPPRVRRATRKAAPKAQAPEAAPEAAATPAPAAPGVLATREDQARYILAGRVDRAGNAHGGRFTLVSAKSGARYTYRVKPPSGAVGAPCKRCDGTGYWQGRRGYPCRACDATGIAGESDRLFVSVLTGQDNTSDYSYLGQIITRPHPRYEHGRKSRLSPDAPSARAIAWYCARLFGAGSLADVTVYHDGTCGRCGRDLTDPLSVARGIGPECWEQIAAIAER
jgi:hypothetical protein